MRSNNYLLRCTVREYLTSWTNGRSRRRISPNQQSGLQCTYLNTYKYALKGGMQEYQGLRHKQARGGRILRARTVQSTDLPSFLPVPSSLTVSPFPVVCRPFPPSLPCQTLFPCVPAQTCSWLVPPAVVNAGCPVLDI
ncbi:uncharacterized protein LY79DRAFT_330293 [Colletotrichum navitas]|uniref:Uncharacterized protein n=1 Tax=Colletotrichum navitas TaxID=681940 RepID=A0AAD8PTZ0_9PEZI|nr:uncharacterized protein LY79DRAFT_330293 [Colletotrichum navitas]KAK1579977.1 hypothetical protein LY79DRAFT_330293 [Colletotrichum navitas]